LFFFPDLWFDELEELGFSLAFFEEKSQIVGTLYCFIIVVVIFQPSKPP